MKCRGREKVEAVLALINWLHCGSSIYLVGPSLKREKEKRYKISTTGDVVNPPVPRVM